MRTLKLTNFLVFFALCIFAACQKSQMPAKERHAKQILSLSLLAEPPSLDPGIPDDASSQEILSLLFEGLTRSSPESRAELAIAHTIDLSEDGKTYTFHLRRTQWSNKDPLTAHDFVFAWKRALSPTFPSENAQRFYPIAGAEAARTGKGSLDAVGIKALDDYTLIVHLHHPCPSFLQFLQRPPFLPVHQASVEKNSKWAFEAGKDFVGNGPFTLSEWSHHNQLTLTRNVNYWDAEAIRLQGIVGQIVEEGNTLLALYDNEDLDWTAMPTPKEMQLKSLNTLQAENRIAFSPLAAGYYYAFNVSQPPFDHPKFRKAFAYAINRQEIADNIGVCGKKATTRYLPGTMALTAADGFQDNNLPTARRLFQEALDETQTAKDELAPIILTYSNTELQHKIAQAIQQQWKAAFGITIQLKQQEWKVFLDQLSQKQFSLAGLGWSAICDDPFHFMQKFTRQNDGNYTGWSDPRFVGIMNEAENTVDATRRNALLLEAENLILEEMPLIPIETFGQPYLHHPRLKNYFIDPIGTVNLRYSYFDNK